MTNAMYQIIIILHTLKPRCQFAVTGTPDPRSTGGIPQLPLTIQFVDLGDYAEH